MHKLRHIKDGFSLIELLVVVAIIGILAAVGLTGYQLYISSTRDVVTTKTQGDVQRAIDADVISLRNNINARSAYAEGFDENSFCYQYRGRIIERINFVDEKRNSFNNQRLACNGNGMIRDGHATVDGTLIIPRGGIMMACLEPEAAVTGDNFGFYTCSCTGQDNCETSNRPTVQTQTLLDTSSNLVTVVMSTDDNASMSQIATGGQIALNFSPTLTVSITYTACIYDSSASDATNSTYICQLANSTNAPIGTNATIVGSSDSICWTPEADPPNSASVNITTETYDGCL